MLKVHMHTSHCRNWCALRSSNDTSDEVGLQKNI